MAWIEKVWQDGDGRRALTGITQKAEKRDRELGAAGYTVRGYRVGNREPGGRKVYKTVARKQDADRLKREIETALEKESYITKSDRQRPLGEYFDSHLKDDIDLRDSTRYNKQQTFNVHVREILGDRPISSIKPEDIRSILSSPRIKDKPSARQKVYTVLTTTFKQAVGDGLILRSPMDGVKRPKIENSKPRLVTTDELYAIVSKADERYQLPIMVAAACGLRAGEVGGLRVGDVDFKAHTISIRQAVTRGSSARIGPPKTEASRRTITVNEVTDAIAAYIQKYGTAEDGRIFTTNGHHGLLSNDRLGHAFREGQKKAGIEADYEGRTITIHGLRHFAASMLIKRGLNVKQVQKFLGHATAAETLDTYADLWPEDLDACAAVSSEVMSGYPPLGNHVPALTA